MFRFAGIIALACVMSAGAIIGPADAEMRRALVIGNSAYTIGALGNPANDADLMTDSLRADGFDATRLNDLGYRD